jgi:hypothetical protein
MQEELRNIRCAFNPTELDLSLTAHNRLGYDEEYLPEESIFLAASRISE